MERHKFEFQLIFHCAAVLSGKKPSNLICFSKESVPNLRELIAEYSVIFKRNGLAVRFLDDCEHRYMLLIYRPELLERYISYTFIRRLLTEDGYGLEDSLEQLLDHLSYRLQTCPSFPHEIGLFLGYRASDVICFQKYQGVGCKLCGYWKVYCSVKRSKKCFQQFDSIRNKMLAMLQESYSFAEILEHQICQPTIYAA